MNRRLFLRRAAIVATGAIAADQLELLERLNWKRTLFPSAAMPTSITIDSVYGIHPYIGREVLVLHMRRSMGVAIVAEHYTLAPEAAVRYRTMSLSEAIALMGQRGMSRPEIVQAIGASEIVLPPRRDG